MYSSLFRKSALRPSGPGELTSRMVGKGLVSGPKGETSTGKIVKWENHT